MNSDPMDSDLSSPRSWHPTVPDLADEDGLLSQIAKQSQASSLRIGIGWEALPLK